MATRYVRSTDGSNSDDGSTWALAKLDLAGAAAIDTAGDTIWVSDNHAESTASAISIALAGTLASPTQIRCGDDAAEPPTALATTGSVSTTGASNITITGSAFSIYGLAFAAGNSTNAGQFNLGTANQGPHVFESCSFTMSNNSNSWITGTGTVTFLNCTFTPNNVANRIFLRNGGVVRGGTFGGGLGMTGFFGLSDAPGTKVVEGLDMSGGGATSNLINVQYQACSETFVIRNCKLPASWSGNLISGALTWGGVRCEMHNCDSADTNYRLWIEAYAGSIKNETTIVKSGGASDGTTSLAWKMATNANAEYPVIILRSPEIVKWNETTGSAITVTVEIVHDSQGSGTSSAFTDKEIWLEVQYLGTSGFPLSLFVDDAAADVLASAADQTSSSETWTTTGLSTPVKQKLSVSFTPQEKGYIHAVVCMAGASDTCYVDPELTVS